MTDRRWQIELRSLLKKQRTLERLPLPRRFGRNFTAKLFIPFVALLVGWVGILQEGAIADTIIGVSGGVATIDRDNPPRNQLAQPGMNLLVGDLIRPNRGAVVEIRCDSGTIRRVRSLVGLGDICPESLGRRYPRHGRGEDDFLLFLNNNILPYPYATQVTDAQPELQWNPVEGATAYQVQILQNDEVLWQESVTGTRIIYGGEGLEPGGRYTLVVRAVGADGVEGRWLAWAEPVSHRLLRRLSHEEEVVLQEALNQLDGQDLGDVGRAIALAQTLMAVDYRDELFPENVGMVMEAIAALEAVVEAENDSPYLHRFLGDLYLQVGSIDQARHNYGRVIELTHSRTDLASRAAAWVGLANLAALSGDRNMARQQLQLAQINYGAIAAGDRVEQIDAWLEKLD